MIKKLFNWAIGHCFAYFMYDKKYRKSRFFNGRFGGLNAVGWKWAIADFRGRSIFKTNIGVRFPVSPFNTINGYSNIKFDPDDIEIFRGKSKYIQAENGTITIGKGTYIANNTCIVTTNHDLINPDLHQKGKDVCIGEKSWIGFGAIILPGVVLGDHTVVGAGSVVTKSFPDGYCVIAGNPAKVIKLTR